MLWVNKMKKYTIDEIRKARSAVIVHPVFGTLYMQNLTVLPGRKIVAGLVWNEEWCNPFMPEDYYGEYIPMNFPITCIKKLEF